MPITDLRPSTAVGGREFTLNLHDFQENVIWTTENGTEWWQARVPLNSTYNELREREDEKENIRKEKQIMGRRRRGYHSTCTT